MAETNKIISGIVAEEPELNKLFQEALSGIRDDINEAKENVGMYLEAILNSTGGKELYGDLYNKALTIKGNARERQLKFIDMFKDRVTKKEIINANVKKETESPFDHSQLNKMIDEVNQGRKFESVKPVIEPALKQKQSRIKDDEDFDDVDEHDVIETDEYVEETDFEDEDDE